MIESEFLNFFKLSNGTGNSVAVPAVEKALTRSRKLLATRQAEVRQEFEKLNYYPEFDKNLQHEKDFIKILQHPDINKINIENNRIKIETNPISIKYNGKLYPIGKFEILIDKSISIQNVSKKVHGRDHPHVHATIPCFGNITVTVHSLLQEKKYAALIPLCLEYLKRYNDNDDYALHPSKWTEAEKTHEKI